MNTNYLASSALTAIYPTVELSIYIYDGEIQDEGFLTPSYLPPFVVTANVQFASPQKLKFLDGYNQTKIYKNFWINMESITGLNRNISTGGDYLVYDGFKYKIVEVVESFNTDWVLLTGVQGEAV